MLPQLKNMVGIKTIIFIYSVSSLKACYCTNVNGRKSCYCIKNKDFDILTPWVKFISGEKSLCFGKCPDGLFESGEEGS